MADLSEIDRAGPVNIVGRNPGTGLDDNYLEIDVNGFIGSRLYTASGSALNFGQAVMASSIPVTISSDQSALKISNFPTTVDTNYGAVSASTIRTASQIGNATGSALFGAGTTTAQVLRVVLPTDQTAIPVAQSGSWTTGRTWTLASGTDSVSAIQSGTWTIAPLTNSSVVKAQLQDNAGNPLASNNSQLQVRDVLNTAGQYRAQSVTTSAAEALGGGTILANRKVLTICPTNGTVYWGYSNAVTTSTGTPIFKNEKFAIAVTDNVHVYLIAGSTIDCRISEGS